MNWFPALIPEPLDMILFHNSKGTVNHAGIILDSERFIQTCRAGTIISRLESEEFKDRLDGYYRYKGKQ